MKLLWTTDEHIGNYGKNGGSEVGGINQRCGDTLGSLEYAVDYGVARGVQAHLHLGDLFDYERIEPQISARVQQVLKRLPSWMLVGNHDQKSDMLMDNAMAPLAPVARVYEAGFHWVRFADDAAVLMIPFRAGRAEVWLPELLAEVYQAGMPEAKCVVLAFHLGVSDSRTPYYLDGTEDSITLDTLQKMSQLYGFTHIFAGNWHKHMRWTVEGKDGAEVDVVQVGTLCPNRFTDTDGRFGTLAVLDTSDGKVDIVDVPGPRFIKLTGVDEISDLVSGGSHQSEVALAKPLYVSAVVEPDEQDEAEEVLGDMKAGPWSDLLRAYEIHIDRTAEKAQTEKAVQEAVAAQSHEEAVRSFVASAALPEEVPRDQVQAFVDQCLKEAKSS